MSQHFSHTPFAHLCGKLAPSSVSSQKGASASPREKVLPASGLAPETENDADEATLFLNAVRLTSEKSKMSTVKRGGFALEEADDFRRMMEKDKGTKAVTRARESRQQSAAAEPSAVYAESEAPANDLDEEHFLQVMREVSPLSGKGRAVAPEVQPGATLQQAENALQDFMDGKLEFALSLTGEYLEGHVVGLDDITMNQLRAGQYSPEAHLDLHSLTTVQAFQALLGFFRGAWYKGLRSVLVIPGRGRNSPDGFGILRDKLQTWLTQDPFKRVVLAFCTARPVDGGPGSVYVLLRKYRKKGKICWEKMPADPDLF